MQKPINRFVLYPGKSDQLLLYGDQYFKSWDINFTNKMLKENSTPLITMRLEKENNFIDLEFIKGTETFVMLSKTGNQIFIFHKKVLVNHISDYKSQDDKSASSDSDSYADNIEDSGNFDEEEMFSDKQKVKKQESLEDTRRKMKGHDTNIKDKIGNANLINQNEEPDKDPEFQSLAVTNKHMVIGTKGGYLIVFERSQK